MERGICPSMDIGCRSREGRKKRRLSYMN
uniref:Uncharacterized protein n=1 Tax=Vitis vinifera TaxID=29760 RepID=F6GYF3_VITVI